MRRSAIAWVLAGTIGLAGCGGGSSEEPIPGGGGSSAVSADFTPAQPSPPSGSVALEKGALSADLVTVRVDVTGQSNVYGGAFDLTFDGTVAEYVGWTAGTLLEQGGHTPTYQVSSPSPGRVVVGATRTGNVAGASTAGSTSIVSLTFRMKQVGSAAVTFQSAVLYDAQNPPQPISGITWHAGTLLGS